MKTIKPTTRRRSTIAASSRSNGCHYTMFAAGLLLQLCFIYGESNHLSANVTEQHSLVDIATDQQATELPRPNIASPLGGLPGNDQMSDERAQVMPRRHKTRRKTGANSSTSTSSTVNSNHTNRRKTKPKKRKNAMQTALQSAARKGLEAMIELYDRREPEMLKRGAVLDANDPGALLAQFSASNQTEADAKAAYASLVAAKMFKASTNVEYVAIGRQAPPKISLKKTPLERLCPSREPPRCVPASLRYRTHDGTCNNARRPRWGSAQMPFHRFLAPEYNDGVEGIRRSVTGASLPSARFVSLVVHGSRNEEAPVTMMLALWGQLIDHDLTATAQPRPINGSTPRCCGEDSTHPSCLPIKVPHDDPWLSQLGVRCLEFLRSAPAQRRDCLLSWREQTNQATAYLDASPIYSSNPRSSDNARIFRQGMLLFGRGPPHEDVCFRAALANQCIRPGDSRSGEQPGLLMMHMIWVNEHNQIATRLAALNPHWSDEKVYQETRRIVGALFQHITFREFLPLVLGRDVCRLFDLELETSGYYRGYDSNVNPTVANEFSAAAFRFGHSLIQNTYMRADRNHRFIANNVSLHEDTAEGDFGGPGSLHRLLRGMVNQRALKRDEFITAELTNHLFQTKSFPFGLDLAAINIQRGRDHGLPAYVNWRGPCGLSTIRDWSDLDRVMGPASTNRLRKAYRTIDDIDLFVGGLAERPVVGGIVGPTFACIIAQQFSNLRKGDRFWYENAGFESSFTPAQLESIRQVALSQVLCRALGGGGTLQPFAFLPPDFGQNERLPCETRLMAPIDLDPWAERDPFTNDAANANGTNEEDDDEEDDSEEEEQEEEDNTDKNETEPSMDTTAATAHLTTFSSTTTTTRGPPTILLSPLQGSFINKVDLITNGNTGLQQRPTVIKGQKATATTLTAPTPTILVSNKLDLNPPTATNRPSQPQILVAGATVVDHKLDLKTTTTTKRPSTTKRKQTRKPTTKKRPQTAASISNRPVGGISNNLDFSASRRTVNGSTTTRRRRTRRTATQRDARHGTAYYYQTPAPTDYTDDYDDEHYNSDYDPPPYLAYGYHRPSTTTTTTTTSEPPYAYYPFGGYYTVPSTTPPQPPYPYFDTRRPTLRTRTTTVRRRLSDKLTLSDATSRPRPNENSDLTRPNKPFLKPASGSSSHSSVFSVDFRRSLVVHGSGSPVATAPTSTMVASSVASPSTTNGRNKLSANQLLSELPQRRTFFASNGTRLASLSSSSLPSDLPMKLSESFSTNDYDDYQDYQTTLQTKRDEAIGRPTIERLQEEHDGYLRPEQTHFEPLVRPDSNRLLAYRDYYGDGATRTLPYRQDFTATADRTRNDIDSPLFRPDAPQTVRYASTYNDPLLLDDYSDKFVGLLLLDDSDRHDRRQGHRTIRLKERSIRDDVTTNGPQTDHQTQTRQTT
uniref:Oxidase/peroxidase n=2 Tax=Anopheles darlingi TaxID=43151 RepID=A0A903WPU3_ANODA